MIILFLFLCELVLADPIFHPDVKSVNRRPTEPDFPNCILPNEPFGDFEGGKSKISTLMYIFRLQMFDNKKSQKYPRKNRKTFKYGQKVCRSKESQNGSKEIKISPSLQRPIWFKKD